MIELLEKAGNMNNPPRREAPKPGPNSLSNNPIVLLITFLLELAMLAALAYWGWTQHEGLLRWLLAIGLPLIAAVLWGVFRVDGAPGKAPVRIAGWLRLLLELGLYAVAVVLLAAAGQTTGAIVLAVAVIACYLVSYEQVLWKIRQ